MVLGSSLGPRGYPFVLRHRLVGEDVVTDVRCDVLYVPIRKGVYSSTRSSKLQLAR